MLKRLLIGILCTLPLRCHAEAFWSKITWNTPDGVQLVGLYHPAQRANTCTWVLLHGLGSVKEEWEAFGHGLADQGAGVFIYDARGHHESNRMMNGTTVAYTSWTMAGPGTPWDRMPADLESAVTLLHEKRRIPLPRIAVGGASLGANVALLYASRHPDVPAIVLLSPGLEYAGIASVPAYRAYVGRPLWMAASPTDHFSYATVEQLKNGLRNAATTVVEGKEGHGVEMLKDNDFKLTLLKWMAKTSWK